MRRYPTSEVKGQTLKGHHTGSAAAKRNYPTSEVRTAPRVPGCDGTGTAERSYPASEVRGCGREELPHTPKPEARGGGREDQPHVQGDLSARAQEGLEELSHIEGQEGRR